MPNGTATKLAQAGLAGVCIALIGLVGYIVKMNYGFIAGALDRNTTAFNELSTTLKDKGVVAELRASIIGPDNTEIVKLPEDAVQELFGPVPYQPNIPSYTPPLAQIVAPEPRKIPISNDPAVIAVLEEMGIATTTQAP